MEYVLICLAALLGSGLTLFSGFGLGTILLPVFALFFPVDVAIALTAVVHFLNNLFKFFLLGKKADRSTLIRFGIPAVLAALLGAWTLTQISDWPEIASYSIGEHTFHLLPLKVIVGILLIFFALFELIPALNNVQFDRKYLPVGGILSGFFGGLSGHQGALRSAFLIKSGIGKEAFVATGIVIALGIDSSRLLIYASSFRDAGFGEPGILIAASLSAFAGAFIGNLILKKITFRFVQLLVGVFLLIFSFLLILGIV